MKIFRKEFYFVMGMVCFLSLDLFAAQAILVSDIDDTIKATGIHEISTIGINAPSTIAEFAGMSILYNSWHRSNSTTGKIYYLTAAPKPVDILGVQFLQASGFPSNTNNVSKDVISGRNTLTESSGEYKTKQLIKIFDNEKPETMILIGDNGEQDIIAYGNLINYVKKSRATTKVFVYIHHVYEAANKCLPIPKEQIAFLTSADLAVHFYNHDWISKENLFRNLKEVAADSDLNYDLTDTVVPSFMECSLFNSWPAIKNIKSLESDFSTEYSAIQSNINQICK
jgi:hypothetical protein